MGQSGSDWGMGWSESIRVLPKRGVGFCGHTGAYTHTAIVPALEVSRMP